MATLQDVATSLQNIAQQLGKLVTAWNPLSVSGSPAVHSLAVFTATNQIGAGGFGGEYLLGSLAGANMNVTTDQAITIAMPSGSAAYSVTRILASNPSISLTTAAGGVYTGAGKTGFAIVAAGQAYSGLTTGSHNAAGSLLPLTVVETAIIDVNTLYLSLTTPQGAAATADIRVYGAPLW